MAIFSRVLRGEKKMTQLYYPKDDLRLEAYSEIKSFLKAKGILFERWQANQALSDTASQEEVLAAYKGPLEDFMQASGYQTADVINVNSQTENIEAIRTKFLKEHTHSEDEVRFFVDGEGYFWFHIEEVFCVKCTKGDFISVPKGAKHWFDLAPAYQVKAIRIFNNKEGWVANYTGSGIDEKFHWN